MVDSLGFSIYQYNMSSAKSNHFNSSFLMGCLSWLSFFPWLYFSGKDFQYHTGWNWWVGILSSSWFKWKSFQLFTVEYDVSCRLVICDLYLGTFILYPICHEFFMKGCHILLNNFFTSIEIIIFLIHFIMCITFIDLYILNHFCIPEINANLIMVCDPLQLNSVS